MAKLGEGDARWIVQDRPDGVNVNNWHWTEKDMMPWSKKRLQELFSGLDLVPGNTLISAQATGVDKVEGEAIVNNRKNKLIPSYELEVSIPFEGTVKDGDGHVAGSVKGSVLFPYISDENADEDPEVRVSTSSQGSAEQRVKDAVLTKGKKVLYDSIRQFVAELRRGGTISSDANQAAPNRTAQQSQPAAAAPQQAAQQAQQAQPEKTHEKKQQKADGTQAIELEERFYARPSDLYECFTNAHRVQGFTQSPATIEPKEGGQFSMFGGSLSGRFTQLQPPSRLAMDWRFSNWEDGVLSKVQIDLSEPQAGTTELKLKHSSIPYQDRYGHGDVVENVRRGWEGQIFQRIKAVFGYGI
ncbi:hypothetical protein WJX72_006227 [[Myrmecia] bisecta]|uniref:Activator of Hsp90 ATPase AHSA1-like N-terminal domain-containing protein n=1 Tax=[Myrmecia] bisecta TaxID=41462 RepID=A0AAW1R7I6_9CHLO